MKLLRRIFLSLGTGILAGLSSAAFLFVLHEVTEFREGHRQTTYFLPFAGAFIGFVYLRYGNGAERGTSLVLDEIHEPKKHLPLRMAPFVFFGTLLTHLVGGSAGREGTAVQVSATLGDSFGKFFGTDSDERKRLLIAGTGAGFGTAIGAPLAGVFFGMEVVYAKRLRPQALLESIVASLAAFAVMRLFPGLHSIFPRPELPDFGWKVLLSVTACGIAFGLLARAFLASVHAVERVQKRFVPIAWLRPVIGGVILIPLYWAEGSFRFTGLGIPVIQQALVATAPWSDVAWKTLFTAITLGSGFKGGEFIPLVFVGTSLGSFIANHAAGGPGFLGALGFSAVFGAASKTPIACTMMAAELFGPAIAPYALLCGLIAYVASGSRSIYATHESV